MAFKLKGNPGVAGSTVLFFLATPGMSDPDFPDFNDAGVKVRGSLYLGDKYLAGTDSYLTLNDGFQLQASVADFSIGPLALSNAAIDIGAGIPVLQPNALARFKECILHQFEIGSGIDRHMRAGCLCIAPH